MEKISQQSNFKNPKERPLEGFSIASTAVRRKEELKAMLEATGAKVAMVPMTQLDHLGDQELKELTLTIIKVKPSIVIITTADGLRNWIQVAESWGLDQQLRETLTNSMLITRGPKAKGAAISMGLNPTWSPQNDSIAEIWKYLISQQILHTTIAIQLPGKLSQDNLVLPPQLNYQVIKVVTYRWSALEDASPVVKLLEQITTKEIDAIIFTHNMGVVNFIDYLKLSAMFDCFVQLVNENEFIIACIGAVTASPFLELGLEVIQPPKPSIGSLVNVLIQEISARIITFNLVSGRIEIRGHGVLFRGETIFFAPGPMAILKALAKRDGAVVTRKELLAHLPSSHQNDSHALEMTISRIRSCLGPEAIQTVFKRGYRLAIAK